MKSLMIISLVFYLFYSNPNFKEHFIYKNMASPIVNYVGDKLSAMAFVFAIRTSRNPNTYREFICIDDAPRAKIRQI